MYTILNIPLIIIIISNNYSNEDWAAGVTFKWSLQNLNNWSMNIIIIQRCGLS